MTRVWGPNDGGIPLSADNMNGIETDLLTALWAEAAVTSKTANYTLTTADKVVFFNGTNLTATLPDPTGLDKRVFRIKNTGFSNLTVVSAGTSKMLDKTPSRILTPNQSLTAVSDGSQWVLLTNGVLAPAPAVRTFASAYGATGTTASVTIPATAEVGDTLVVFIGSNYNVTAAASSGWTVQGATNLGFHNGAVYSKICTAGDIGAVASFTLSGSEPWNIFCVVAAGAASIPAVSVTQAISGATISSAAITGQLHDTVLMLASQRAVGTTITVSQPSTLIGRRTGDATLSSAAFAFNPAVTANIQPTFSSGTNGQGWGTALVVLRAV